MLVVLLWDARPRVAVSVAKVSTGRAAKRAKTQKSIVSRGQLAKPKHKSTLLKYHSCN